MKQIAQRPEKEMISGLDDVVVAETVLSDVDGQAGRLVIRGHSLEELVDQASFEDVLILLWQGFFEELSDVPRRLGAARLRLFAHLKSVDAQLLRRPVFDAVRALVARLDDGDDLNTALMLVAAPAVFTPGILRLQKGLEPIPPNPTLGHAADILTMLHGQAATPPTTAALDRYLVTASDHGLNASTFVARIVASTHAGLTSTTIAAMGALKGPLHGGAPGPVLDMLDEVGDPAHASSWLEAALARGDRLMGFGHRVYRVRDPRADALKETIKRLASAQVDVIRPGAGHVNSAQDGSREASSNKVNSNRLQLAEAVEAAALDLLARKKPNRSLQTNTEFYTAVLLEAVGLPREAFTCAFAASRMIGWIAHAREQMQTGRLIRPQSRYVGPQPSVGAHSGAHDSARRAQGSR